MPFWVWCTLPLTVAIVGLPLAVILSNRSPVLTRHFLQSGPPPDRLIVIQWHSPSVVLTWIFAAAVALQMAHFMSPIAATWLSPSFRPVMLDRKPRYIWWPLAIVAGSALIGVATQLGWTSYDLRHPHQLWRVTGPTNPFPLLFWVFWAWNAWHFSRQNFGVLLLCGASRHWAWIVGFGGTMFAMVGLPYIATALGLSFVTMLAMTGLVSAGHWFIELGMTSRIAARTWRGKAAFLAALLMASAAGFLWTIPSPYGPMLVIMPWLMGTFLGLNFVHFWYDQWIYRFSDPAVRATIGKDLLANA